MLAMLDFIKLPCTILLLVTSPIRNTAIICITSIKIVIMICSLSISKHSLISDYRNSHIFMTNYWHQFYPRRMSSIFWSHITLCKSRLSASRERFYIFIWHNKYIQHNAAYSLFVVWNSSARVIHFLHLFQYSTRFWLNISPHSWIFKLFVMGISS